MRMVDYIGSFLFLVFLERWLSMKYYDVDDSSIENFGKLMKLIGKRTNVSGA